jgi:hypothetical protein
LETKLSGWSKRNLTLIGKILIAKSVGLSQLVYGAAVLCVPDYVCRKTKDLIYKFIWSGKKDRIKRATLIGDYSDGGLKAPDVDSMFTSIKARWVYRLYTDCSNWSLLPRMYFEQFGPGWSIFQMNWAAKYASSSSLPLFYKQVLASWIQCGGCNVKNPSNFSEVRKQFLWGNKLICFRNKPLFYRHWIDSGIKYVNDLLNIENVISVDTVYRKLRRTHNWLAEFYTVVNSIPCGWKRMLQTDESRMTKVKCNPMLLRFDEHKGYLRDDGNARSLYHYLVAKKHCRSHMEQYWALKCGCHITNFEWQSIWLLTKFLEEKKLAIFRYKMLHNILPCRFLLHRWRLADSPLCNICNVQEDYEHMFIKCRKIQDSWKTLCDCFERLGISNIRPCLKLLVMGYKIIQSDYIELNEVLVIFLFVFQELLFVRRLEIPNKRY